MAKTMDGISPKQITPDPEAEAKPQAPAEAVQATASSGPIEQSAESEEPYESLFPEPTVSISSPPAWIWWALLLIAAVALGLLGYFLANGKVNQWLSVSSTPAPSAIATKATPVPTAAATPVATPSATTAPTAAAVATASASAASVTGDTVRVLNGTTTNGAAAAAAASLRDVGFTVTGTGNAERQDYSSSIVYYGIGQQAAATAVQQHLSGYSSTLEQNASIVGSNDVVVVLGPKS